MDQSRLFITYAGHGLDPIVSSNAGGEVLSPQLGSHCRRPQISCVYQKEKKKTIVPNYFLLLPLLLFLQIYLLVH
jgi:hypothetical protein